MSDLITALGLALVIEGALYALFPAGMRRLLARALAEPEGLLRWVGLIAAAAGVLVVALARG